MIRMWGLAALLLAAAQAGAVPLPVPVRTELRQAGIPLDSVGVEVREVHAHKPLVSLNARRPMHPASVMKLLTTYAALDLLGPAYAWKTEAWLDGDMKDGVLRGNLILKGYGDPALTIEQFWLWLAELRVRGLREIHGDLVLDRSYFDLPDYDPGAFDNDPVRPYNVGPDALLLNFNTLRLRYLPDGGGLKVVADPPLDGIRVDNRLVPRLAPEEGCDDWDGSIRVQPGGDAVVLEGGFPDACGEREQNLNVMPHPRYVEAVFRALWKELGGSLDGKLREGQAGGGARLFSTHYSEPLGTVIRKINKFSNNVMARQVFLTLGAAGPAAGEPAGRNTETRASAALSIRAVQDWLRQKRIDLPGLVLENGAGLSRIERITPDGMADLLQSAAAHPFGAELEASLPILGVDGTVKKRLRDSDAVGRAHLKTGTLEGVKTMAGYVDSRSGKQWIVVFFINHPNAKRGAAAQDALIEWLAGR